MLRNKHLLGGLLFFLGLVLSGCPGPYVPSPPAALDFTISANCSFSDIHLTQGYSWDCCPTSIKMWARYLGRLANNNSALNFDTDKFNKYDNIIWATSDDFFVKDEYRKTLTGSWNIDMNPQTCLDTECYYWQNLDIFVPWNTSFNEPAVGTLVLDPAFLTDSSGKDYRNWNDEDNDIKHIIFTSLFIQELFEHFTLKPLVDVYYDSTDPDGDNGYCNLTPVYDYMERFFPYPLRRRGIQSVYNITSIGESDSTGNTVDCIFRDDVDEFVKHLITWLTYGRDVSNFESGTNYGNVGLLLLTLNKPNDISRGLHYVLVTGVKVHFPPNVAHTWANAEYTFLVHNPYPDPIDNMIRFEEIPLNDFKGRVTLTNGGTKIFPYTCMAIYLGDGGAGNRNYGRAVSGTRGLSGTDPTAIPNQDIRGRFDFYRRKMLQERAKKALPAILELLLE